MYYNPMTRSVILQTESETAMFARYLSSQLQGGNTLGLCGDLGAGKTTLVRFLVQELGGSSEQVSSPSFSLENEYRLSAGRCVQHWDLYRLRELPIELLEAPGDKEIRIVEWPDRMAGYVESLDLVVILQVGDSGERIALLSGPLLGLYSDPFHRESL